ncbi:MAG: hypothetical protein K5871_03455 [Lachnospiraceae bacterium]|nr:hypothetical protein [Lachnospiraceae bacterium]
MENNDNRKSGPGARNVLMTILAFLMLLVAIAAWKVQREAKEARARIDAELAESLSNSENLQERLAAANQEAQERFNQALSGLNGEADEDDPYARREFDGPDPRIVTATVPDHIAHRGIILRGAVSESGSGWRLSPRGNYSWNTDYVTDCNLNVETNGIELTEFAERLGENYSYFRGNGDIPAYYSASVGYGNRNYVIYRTDSVRWECSEGRVYEDGDPGRYVDIYFDPSGKYIFSDTYGEYHDPLLLTFLEPVMVKVETAFQTSEDPEVIAAFVDGMHELVATYTDMNAADILKIDDKACITFTASDGYVYNYYYTQDHYIVIGDDVYYVEDLAPLLNVMEK